MEKAKREVQLQRSFTITFGPSYIAPEGGGLVSMTPSIDLNVQAGDWLDLDAIEKGIIQIRKRDETPQPDLDLRACSTCGTNYDLRAGKKGSEVKMHADGIIRETFNDAWFYILLKAGALPSGIEKGASLSEPRISIYSR